MKTKLIRFMVCAMLLWAGSVYAATVQSIDSGDWSNPGIWSTGSVPGQGDAVTVRHRVTHGATLFLNAQGTLLVAEGGHLSIAQDLNNAGYVTVNDTLELGGLENDGTVENNAFIHQRGDIENHNGGMILNYGTIFLDGDLENNGTFFTTGEVYMQGDLENWGVIESPPGSHGYFDVCGSAKHHTGAVILGTNYLCLRCGGSYDREPGRVGDFILLCRPFAVLIGELKATVTPESTVRLDWSTLTESNSDWFVIERARGLGGIAKECRVGKCGKYQDFVEIGRVKGAGNSSSPLSYTFTDPQPLPGLNYYRLRMVDMNGQETYTAVVDAVVDGGGVVLLAYPNPNNSILHVQASGQAGATGTLTMYNIEGKRVWERELSLSPEPQRIDIPVCDFASGVYLLKLRQGGKEEVRKLIFEK